MSRCDVCNERLLDYVYGLLDGDELRETREHLHSCAACQTALAQVQAEQALMARAARAIENVPEFTLPSETTEIAPASSAPAAMMSASLPSAKPSSGRSFWQRPWVAWTVAASLLIGIGSALSFHQYQITGYQKELTAQRSDFRDIDIAYEALPAKYEQLQKHATEKLREGAPAHLHILGPTRLQPNARAKLHITTRNADGEPAPATLRFKLVEAHSNNIVQFKHLQSDAEGQAVLELDASKAQPNSLLHVMVESEIGTNRAAVTDIIRMQPPTYVTRVDTNKAVYQINDVLFFRVLVLDRCSLQPPAQPILLRVRLKNPKDETVAQLDAPTSEGGILAREFPIAQSFLAGGYTLSVSPLDPAQTLVQSATQKLEVVRDLRTPDIQLDQDRYLPGDTITGVVRGGAMPERATGTFGQSAPVPVTIQPGLGGFGGGGNAPGGGFGGTMPELQANAINDNKKNMLGMQRFSAKLPSNLPEGARYLPFTLEYQNGLQKQAYRGVVPIEPTDYDIDFFPEGGDLIAGVLNRVYYRLRSTSGDAVTSDGQVMLMTGKNEIVDSRYQLGMGYFDFTPDTKETYTVRITTPVKPAEIKQPFARLGGIRPAGVVLHIPSAVGKQGDAIRLTLRNQGPARKLLLAAQCRGQIVDQRWVNVKAGSQDFTLQPAEDARGIVKVTAYEVADRDALRPVAERLVYRAPVQRLDIGLQFNSQQHEPGKNLQLNITARTENGDAATGWLLASVVDERFQTRSRSLSAHFLLLNEIRTGSELEDADVVLHDAPESAAILSRFLGTHGWRRFLHLQEPARAVAGAKANDIAALVFSRESVALEQLHQQNEARYAAALQPLHRAALLEESHLKLQRTHASAMVLFAENQLREYEETVQLLLRLGLVAVMASLFLASLTLMILGVYRVLWQHRPATPAFGGAFSCLIACLLVMLAGNLFGPLPFANPGADNIMQAVGKQVEDKLNERFAQAPLRRDADQATAPVGAFAMRAPAPIADSVMQTAIAQKKDDLPTRDAVAALQEQQLARMARLDQTERANRVAQNRINNQSDGMQAIFRRASPTLMKTAKSGKKSDVPKAIQPLPETKGKSAPPAAKQAPAMPVNQGDEIEYAFKYAPNMFADTLLWNPRLQLVHGQADARFDIAIGQASYRVLLLGHSPTGRFGFHETRIDVLSVQK
jgi:hypothetical protein